MSEQGFRLQSSTALRRGMCHRSSEKPRQSTERAAVLRWPGLACWEASPRAQLVSQPQVQAPFSFWKRVSLFLLFLTISIPKSLNKACYSKSNWSLHGRLFLFPSLFPHSAAGGPSSGAMGSHRREEQPPSPPAISAGTFPRSGP